MGRTTRSGDFTPEFSCSDGYNTGGSAPPKFLGMLRRCTVSVFLHPWACWQQLEVMAPGARFSMSVGMEIGMLREY